MESGGGVPEHGTVPISASAGGTIQSEVWLGSMMVGSPLVGCKQWTCGNGSPSTQLVNYS